MSESFIGRIKRGVLEKIDPERVTRAEQLAFLQVANKLIFNKRFKILITPENARKVSQAIQDDFQQIKQDIHNTFEDILDRARTEISRSIQESEDLKPDHIVMKPIESIPDFGWEGLTVTERTIEPKEFVQESVHAVFESYEGWGFTPKLSISGEQHGGVTLNCLGFAINNGIDLKEVGENPSMLVGVDHPEAIVVKDNQIYINEDTLAKTSGVIFARDGYKIIRSFQKYKDDVESTGLKFIFPFDDAVLYEILENIEVLRKLSVGEEVYTLPGSLKKGQELAKKYARVLQATDWRVLQRKLFPDIVRAFEESKDEFEKTIAIAREDRIIDLGTMFLSEGLRDGQAKTKYRDMEFQEAQEKIMQESKEFGLSIVNYLYMNKPFGYYVPEYIQLFWKEVKNKMETANLEKEILDQIVGINYLMISKKILDEEEYQKLLAKVPN